MSLRLFSRSFLVSTRLSTVPIARAFSTSTHSYMDRPKPPPTSVVEPIMSTSAKDFIDDEFAATNSDADYLQQSQQRRDVGSMSMMDDQAKDKYEMSSKDDWTEEAEAMAQDIHTSRGQKPPVDPDYM